MNQTRVHVTLRMRCTSQMPQRPTAHASVLEDYWIGPTLVSLAYGSASPHEHTNQRRSVPTRSLTLRRRRPTITHHQTSTSRALRQAPLVLIVDDSADTRELYTEYLTKIGRAHV